MTVTQVSSGSDLLLVEIDFPEIPALRLFDYWTRPSLLTKWWPQEAELVPQVGGYYHFSWSQMNWHLRGCYTGFEPGERLSFTWKWDHEGPDAHVREVRVIFAPMASEGTHLLLAHGPYLDTPEDQVLRLDHHLAGWQHFLPRLQQVSG